MGCVTIMDRLIFDSYESRPRGGECIHGNIKLEGI